MLNSNNNNNNVTIPVSITCLVLSCVQLLLMKSYVMHRLGESIHQFMYVKAENNYIEVKLRRGGSIQNIV